MISILKEKNKTIILDLLCWDVSTMPMNFAYLWYLINSDHIWIYLFTSNHSFWFLEYSVFTVCCTIFLICYFNESHFFIYLFIFNTRFPYLVLSDLGWGYLTLSSIAIWQHKLEFLFHWFSCFKLYVGIYIVEPWQAELIPSSFWRR